VDETHRSPPNLIPGSGPLRIRLRVEVGSNVRAGGVRVQGDSAAIGGSGARTGAPRRLRIFLCGFCAAVGSPKNHGSGSRRRVPDRRWCSTVVRLSAGMNWRRPLFSWELAGIFLWRT